MNLRIILPLAAIVLSGTFSWANLLSEVPSHAQDELAAGQLVVKSQNVNGDPWPRLMLYQVVDAPPNVVWKLFNDYSAAPSYTPGLISAKVLSTNSDGTKDVEYTVKVPVIQRATYTVQNSYITKGSMREVSWKLLKSPLAKSSDGSLRIQPYGKNQTIMCYTNLCVPITNLLAGLKNEALNAAKETVRALKAEAERRAAAQS
jgi:ribosome-associated toxin RatA of RatAB toxin-antitoxin module